MNISLLMMTFLFSQLSLPSVFSSTFYGLSPFCFNLTHFYFDFVSSNILSMAAHSEHQANVPALFVDTGISASPGADTMTEGGSAAATVLQSEVLNWSVAVCKSRYSDCLDARWFTA